jgi:hypothetical protein
MTHVVVDRSEYTMRPLLGPSTWRAPWWCTPFGPEQMRQARIPAPDLVRPGTAVTEDSVLALVLQPGTAASLSRLADVLSRNAQSPDPAQRELAVLLIDAVDDAAQWIGALLSCTAPEPARSVCWSTLERVHGGRDLERLRRSGLDIAAVPRADVQDGMDLPAGCIVIDPSRPAVGPPATIFGRFVRAMASDPGLWFAAHEAIEREVMSQLVDQAGVPLSWPAAMAQARSWLAHGTGSALFEEAYPGDLRSDVESVLLRATIPALEDALPGMAEDLRAAKESLIGEARQRTPQGWRELCRRIGDSLSPERALLFGRLYLDAAVLDQAWLRQDRAGIEPLPETVRTALTGWSTDPRSAGEVDDCLRTARRALEEHPPPLDQELSMLTAGGARARLVTGLLEDGVVLGPGMLEELLSPLAQEILAPEGARAETGPAAQGHLEVVSALPQAAREVLAVRLEQGLAARAGREIRDQRRVQQPVLAPLLALALAEAAVDDGRPWLALQCALGAVTVGVGDSSAVLAALLEPVRQVHAAGTVLHLDSAASAALEHGLHPDHLAALSGFSTGTVPQVSRWALLAALSDAEGEGSAELLRARRRGTPAIASATREPVVAPSWEDSAVLLAEALASPFLTDRLASGRTWAWAENAHVAAVQLRDNAERLPEAPQLRSLLSELARRGELRSAAVLVLLSVGSQRFGLEGVRTRVDLEALVAAAVRDPRGLLAPCAPSWGRAALDALRTIAAESATTVPAPAAQPSAPSVVDAEAALRDAAAAVLDARLRSAQAADLPRLLDEARAEFRGDPAGWARAQRAVPSLKESISSRAERLGDIVKKNLNLLPWQRKEGRDG